MLFDTDVLIWVLRGHDHAARVVEATEDRSLSIINYMELLQGARGKKEVQLIKSFIVEFSFLVLPLTENIGHRALVYLEEYRLSSGMFLADALVAATAVENHLTLITANIKHYKPIRELDLKTFRP
jgi:hypothetical protein